eukprot:scaffold79907_cov34-Tisochrysis_lutea.AAC.2
MGGGGAASLGRKRCARSLSHLEYRLHPWGDLGSACILLTHYKQFEVGTTRASARQSVTCKKEPLPPLWNRWHTHFAP